MISDLSNLYSPTTTETHSVMVERSKKPGPIPVVAATEHGGMSVESDKVTVPAQSQFITIR